MHSLLKEYITFNVVDVQEGIKLYSENDIFLQDDRNVHEKYINIFVNKCSRSS